MGIVSIIIGDGNLLLHSNYNINMKKEDQISFASNRQNVQKLKIVMVGDQNVGKSSIIIRYVKNDFDKTNNVL
jgi:GTPase SAR1 family protein